jgi:hypothetical protein
MVTGPTVPAQQQFIDFPVFNALVPKEGPKIIPMSFDFSAAAGYAVNLLSQYQKKVISGVQCIYIDNSLNSSPVTLTFGTSNQKIICPPLTQGYFPVLMPNAPSMTIASAGGVVVPIDLINVPIQSQVWPISQWVPKFVAGALVVSDATLDATVVAIGTGGTAQGTVEFAIDAVRTDVSGVIAAGGDWQLLTAAAAGRQEFIIQNPQAATETLFFAWSLLMPVSTAGAMGLAPGEGFSDSAPGIVDTSNIWVMAATTGHSFTAKVA